MGQGRAGGAGPARRSGDAHPGPCSRRRPGRRPGRAGGRPGGPGGGEAAIATPRVPRPPPPTRRLRRPAALDAHAGLASGARPCRAEAGCRRLGAGAAAAQHAASGGGRRPRTGGMLEHVRARAGGHPQTGRLDPHSCCTPGTSAAARNTPPLEGCCAAVRADRCPCQTPLPCPSACPLAPRAGCCFHTQEERQGRLRCSVAEQRWSRGSCRGLCKRGAARAIGQRGGQASGSQTA